MAALKEVRQRIRAAAGIQQVTKAMKMVAAVKMRRAEARLMKARPYSAALEEIASLVNVPETSAEAAQDGNEAVVLIGSDGGLCGGFNVSLFRHVWGSFDPSSTVYFAVGRKARQFLAKQNARTAGSFEKLQFPLLWQEAEKIAEEIAGVFRSGSLRSVKLAYQSYVAPGVYRASVERWLPFSIKPAKQEEGREPCFEPGRMEVGEKVLARARIARFGLALMEAQTSEQGARMVAMDSATNNAGELQEDLTKLAQKIRQWNITRELLEITTGVEARKN